MQLFNYTIMENVKGEKALGLVEALISLAIVGTGMVLITSLSLKTLKQARKNEFQDIAVQAAVEAMDTMKQPRDIVADREPIVGSDNYYKLDFSGSSLLVYNANAQNEIEANSTDCSVYSNYYIDIGGGGGSYLYCQQIKVVKISEYKYDLSVIVVWQTVGGDFEKWRHEGYRFGKIGT